MSWRDSFGRARMSSIGTNNNGGDDGDDEGKGKEYESHDEDGKKRGINGLWNVLSGRLNQVTGYEECILFRKRVFEADREYQDAQAAFQSLKKGYEDNLISHSRLQKEISLLLERKQMWTDRDVLAFAELHRQESVLDQSVSRERVRVKELESELDRKQAFFMETVRERYQVSMCIQSHLTHPHTHQYLLLIYRLNSFGVKRCGPLAPLGPLSCCWVRR